MKLATPFDREEGLRLLRSWVMKRPQERSLIEYTLADRTKGWRLEERTGKSRPRHFAVLEQFLTRDRAKFAIQCVESPKS